MRALLALLAIMLPTALVAESADKAPVTMNEAAVLALSLAYNAHPHYYEYGGVIVKLPNGKFSASAPVTDGHASNTSIDEDPDTYDGHNPVVATYHTHPCLEGYVPEVFSPQDLKGSRETQRPGYILDECTGAVHYWAPGDGYDEPRNPMQAIMGVRLATGKIVGHIPVDGKKIEL